MESRCRCPMWAEGSGGTSPRKWRLNRVWGTCTSLSYLCFAPGAGCYTPPPPRELWIFSTSHTDAWGLRQRRPRAAGRDRWAPLWTARGIVLCEASGGQLCFDWKPCALPLSLCLWKSGQREEENVTFRSDASLRSRGLAPVIHLGAWHNGKARSVCSGSPKAREPHLCSPCPGSSVPPASPRLWANGWAGWGALSIPEA